MRMACRRHDARGIQSLCNPYAPSERLARIDPQLLYPVKHRSAQAQADLMTIRARAGLVRARTALVNTARGLAKSYGERLHGCNVRNMNPEKAEGLSPELQAALEPLLNAIESLSERIVEYNDRIENLAQQSYPQVALWGPRPPYAGRSISVVIKPFHSKPLPMALGHPSHEPHFLSALLGSLHLRPPQPLRRSDLSAGCC